MKAARDYPILTVTAKGTRWLESGHPWVYDSDVAREPDESECENGALVDVVSEKGKYLGTGFLSRLSKLRVRIVSRNANDRFDESFWRRRVRYARDYRKAVMDGQTGCCRLIFGEADAFPGLTVDRFEKSSRHADALARHGKDQGHALPPHCRGAGAGRRDDRRPF